MNAAGRIGVLGLARSGRAAAELALANGWEVYASDLGESAELRDAAEAVRRAGGEAELGRHDAGRLAGCDLLVVSPGIPPNAAILRENGVRDRPWVSELEFAFRYLDAPVIAVTGTNGKTTTTALVSHLMAAGGFDAPPAGNIGVALSEVARRDTAPDWVAVEASSFQLGGIRDFSPRIGAVTNLSPDHLDRYPSVESYYADKARLFTNATNESVWILNGESAQVRDLIGDAAGQRLFFGIHKGLENGEAGGWIDSAGRLMIRTREGDELPLVAVDELRLLGEHNRANALAAALAAHCAGVDLPALRAGLRAFRPLEHRLQPVADRDGILWINDSKATNIESTRVALRSMTRPVVLLMGGRGKGEPFGSLTGELTAHARVVIAYGESAERIERELGGTISVERVGGSFDDAVDRARATARPGDSILLSPACASFDMFRDFAERGRAFAHLARTGVEVANGA